MPVTTTSWLSKVGLAACVALSAMAPAAHALTAEEAYSISGGDYDARIAALQ